MSDTRINLEELRQRAKEAIALRGAGRIAMSRQTGAEVLALVEAVEAAQASRKTFAELRDDGCPCETCDALRSALARFSVSVCREEMV